MSARYSNTRTATGCLACNLWQATLEGGELGACAGLCAALFGIGCQACIKCRRQLLQHVERIRVARGRSESSIIDCSVESVRGKPSLYTCWCRLVGHARDQSHDHIRHNNGILACAASSSCCPVNCGPGAGGYADCCSSSEICAGDDNGKCCAGSFGTVDACNGQLCCDPLAGESCFITIGEPQSALVGTLLTS